MRNSPKQRFYRSNTGWVDDYMNIFKKYYNTTGKESLKNEELKKAFANYFKKSKGESTVIYHKDHVPTMTDFEKSIAIIEVMDSGYFNI